MKKWEGFSIDGCESEVMVKLQYSVVGGSVTLYLFLLIL
jgi:hypothetical protein